MTSLVKSGSNELSQHLQLKPQTQHLLAMLERKDKFEIASWHAGLKLENAMDGTQLRAVRMEIGDIPLAKIIFIMLDSLRIALGITSKEKETAMEIESCLVDSATRIVNEYDHLKMEEIALCIHRCKEGYYGKSYGKISMEKIFEWFKKYDEERTASIDQQHERYKDSWGSAADRSPEPILAKNIFEKAVDHKVEQRIKAYRDKVEGKDD